MSDGSHVQGITSTGGAKAAQAAHAAESADEMETELLATERSMIEQGEDNIFNPMYMLRDGKKLDEELKKHSAKEADDIDDDDMDFKLVDDVTKLAKAFEKKHPEMNQRALLGMKADIKETDDAETIYEKVRKFYKDEYLADEAFNFLEQITNPHTNLGRNIKKARALLNARHEREIRSGRNVNDTAREYAKKGLGTTGSLRDLYRDITANPKDPTSLFDELNESFDFEKMKPILSFLLRSLGSDMKSKGPSISKQELMRLFSETRTMQSILGIYRFFFGRMNLIKESMIRENLNLPKSMTYETLAKIFTKYIQERYPSPDKVLRLAAGLGVEAEIIAQIIIFTQYRDALRGVSPRLFRSNKHRQDLLMSFIETISELDDLLEEEEEDDENEDDMPPLQKGWDTTDSIG